MRFSLRVLVFIVVVTSSVTVKAQDSSEAWIQGSLAPQYFAVRVENVERSVEWYSEAFGLNQLGGSRAEDDLWQIENLGNDWLLVEIIRDARDEDSSRSRGIAKVGFYVQDVRIVADRVEQATGERPRVLDFNQLRQRLIQIHDPDGNIIQLFSPLDSQE